MQNFLYGTSGVCKWEPMHTWSKNAVVVQALLLADQGLWFQELCGAYMSFSRSQQHSPPQLQKGSCFCSCVTALSMEAMCTGKEDLSWKLDSYPWAVQDRLALCYMSNESLPWSEPSLCCTFLALLHISMNQCIKTFMYKCDPISIIFPGPKQRDFVINIFSNFGN